MKYYEDQLSTIIYAYDETDPSQVPYIEKAISKGWLDVTSNYPLPGPTPDEIVAAQESVVRNYLNVGVAQRHYDSITTACSYVTSTNPVFKADADACVPWRDDCWEHYLIYVQSVGMGAPVWTDAELIADLPVLVWPTTNAP